MGEMERDLQTDPPCHPRACAIQNCIQRNNYNEEKCRKEVDALYECCNAFYERQGEKASTVSCPKYSLLKLKMQQRAKGIS
ncbi:hypothetical protein COCMIDRAFT_32092 [Bipolaris oryzae ATCC 44560]|uniref:Cx9C motif-containing protein 4, mitochondrial n=1 Tax=Bipolaris oryzae ATCC 44560 TaxID=930090 RepID=W7A3H0_COCMI|nr:uncharacterized protein COCMIDRAFT_32092 [Bipolaris oryzae ATCC 44560]EUC50571.1 hypothetical protein COCMIDRAFT_32092 [Bipolaris oryzae ATCC 44560]